MEYRKASCVELHDPKVMISTKRDCYAFTAPYGRGEGPRKPAYKVSMGELSLLFSALGLSFENSVFVPLMSTHQNYARLKKLNNVDDIELNIYHHYHETSEDSADNDEIVSVECAVIDSRMVDIRITSESDGKTYISEMTHVGTFTIWWEVNP